MSRHSIDGADEKDDSSSSSSSGADSGQDVIRDLQRQLRLERERNEILRVRIRSQKHEMRRQEQLWTTANTHLRPIFRNGNQLPTEIIHAIMLYTLPPSFLLDPCISYGPTSGFTKAQTTKLSLIRVCRAWYHAGLSLLYEDIVIRRIGQMPALLDTLQRTEESSKLGSTVRSVELRCFVPEHYSSSFRAWVNKLDDLCPQLNSIKLLGLTSETFPQREFPSIGVPVTHLSCEVEKAPSPGNSKSIMLEYPVNIILIWHPTLRSLRLTFSHAINWSQAPLVFPELEELTIEHLDNQSITLDQWDLPRLSRLFVITTFGAANTISLAGPLASSHGKNLRVLGLHCAGVVTSNNMTNYEAQHQQSLQVVLDHCPVLEHLIVNRGIDMNVVLNHPTLKWVDVWLHRDFMLLEKPEFSAGGVDDQENYERGSAVAEEPLSARYHLPSQWGKYLLERNRGKERELADGLNHELAYPYLQSSIPCLQHLRYIDVALSHLGFELLLDGALFPAFTMEREMKFEYEGVNVRCDPSGWVMQEEALDEYEKYADTFNVVAAREEDEFSSEGEEDWEGTEMEITESEAEDEEEDGEGTENSGDDGDNEGGGDDDDDEDEDEEEDDGDEGNNNADPGPSQNGASGSGVRNLEEDSDIGDWQPDLESVLQIYRDTL